MSALSVIVMVLLVITMIIVGLLVYDYLKQRSQVTNTLSSYDAKLAASEAQSQTSATAIQTQVNDKMNTLYGMFAASNLAVDRSLMVMQQQNSNLSAAIGGTMDFRDSSGKVVSFDMLGGNTPDRMDMIKHVTMISGMTAADLAPNSNMVKMCGVGGSNCIEIPDKNGNTVLRTLTDSGEIVLDSVARAKYGIAFGDNADVMSAPGIFAQNTDLYMGADTIALSATKGITMGSILPNSTSPGLVNVSSYQTTNPSTPTGLYFSGELKTPSVQITDNNGNSVATLMGLNNTLMVKLNTNQIVVDGMLTMTNSTNIVTIDPATNKQIVINNMLPGTTLGGTQTTMTNSTGSVTGATPSIGP